MEEQSVAMSLLPSPSTPRSSDLNNRLKCGFEPLPIKEVKLSWLRGLRGILARMDGKGFASGGLQG